MSQTQDDIYTYDDSIKLNLNNQNKTYTDHFRIKWWDVNYVLEILAKYGLSIERDLSFTFAGAGSSYFLMRKELGIMLFVSIRKVEILNLT